MKKTTKDYLKFTDFAIYQDDEMFCVNTDTALLGTYLDFKKGSSVLDIGCNNGALLLYASLKDPKELVGIDIFKKALALANENLLMNDVDACLQCVRVQDFNHEPFDIIVANPPFFEVSNPRQNAYKSAAMFETYLSQDDLLAAFKRLLKDNGSIYMIYPADRSLALILNMARYGFKVMEITYVFDANKTYALRVLLKIKKGRNSKTRVMTPIVIKNGEISKLNEE